MKITKSNLNTTLIVSTITTITSVIIMFFNPRLSRPIEMGIEYYPLVPPLLLLAIFGISFFVLANCLILKKVKNIEVINMR